jgi:hypothetical protein
MVNAFYHNNNRVVKVQPDELEGSGANSFYSFILVTSLMIIVAAVMMYFFRKNKWI